MILIGLGANLNGMYGSPEECLLACSGLFKQAGIYISKSSNIWKSAPVPVSTQPWYRNAVCAVETQLTPNELLNALAKIESEAGRVRGEVNAPRVLDLDILSYNDEIINGDILQVPHSRMCERAFVLYPLLEIAPNWIHPIMDKSVDEMIDQMPKDQEIQCIDGSGLLCTYAETTRNVRA